MAKNGKRNAPKKVAGIKVPKVLRKSGALEGLVTSTLGREILAGALVAAASAAGAALRAHDSGARKTSELGKKGADRAAAIATGDLARAAATALAGVVADAAQSSRSKSRQAKREGTKTPTTGG